jgi:hypothetical protein
VGQNRSRGPQGFCHLKGNDKLYQDIEFLKSFIFFLHILFFPFLIPLMNSYQLAKLTAKVKATNAANKNAMALYAAFTPIAQAFIGQKIFKANGELTAKFKAALPSSLFSFHFYRMQSDYSLVYIAKESAQVDSSSCLYAEAACYVGSVTTGTLIQLHDAPNLRTDWSVEEVAKLREECEAAKELARKKESALSTFGMYDN